MQTVAEKIGKNQKCIRTEIGITMNELFK